MLYSFNSEKKLKREIQCIRQSIHQQRKRYGVWPDTLRKVEDFVNEYNNLHIINPTKEKFEETLLSNVYYDLLRMYSNELEKNNTVLFVFGFSFKDEHIYSITKCIIKPVDGNVYFCI